MRTESYASDLYSSTNQNESIHRKRREEEKINNRHLENLAFIFYFPNLK